MLAQRKCGLWVILTGQSDHAESMAPSVASLVRSSVPEISVELGRIRGPLHTGDASGVGERVSPVAGDAREDRMGQSEVSLVRPVSLRGRRMAPMHCATHGVPRWAGGDHGLQRGEGSRLAAG